MINTLVNFPNGISIQATHVSHIKLQSSLWLKDDLYVPSLNFNILSVSKLRNITSCSILFLADQCLIREKDGKGIGFAKQNKGL